MLSSLSFSVSHLELARPHNSIKNRILKKQYFLLLTLCSPQLLFVFFFPHPKVLNALPALLSITVFNLMYEYVIYVARAEDINLFCGGREG